MTTKKNHLLGCNPGGDKNRLWWPLIPFQRIAFTFALQGLGHASETGAFQAGGA